MCLQIEDEVREARRDELVSLQQRMGEEWAKTRVGQEVSEWRCRCQFLPAAGAVCAC